MWDLKGFNEGATVSPVPPVYRFRVWAVGFGPRDVAASGYGLPNMFLEGRMASSRVLRFIELIKFRV